MANDQGLSSRKERDDNTFRCYKCSERYQGVGNHKCPPEQKPIGPLRWSDIWPNPDASISGGFNGK